MANRPENSTMNEIEKALIQESGRPLMTLACLCPNLRSRVVEGLVISSKVVRLRVRVVGLVTEAVKDDEELTRSVATEE